MATQWHADAIDVSEFLTEGFHEPDAQKLLVGIVEDFLGDIIEDYPGYVHIDGDKCRFLINPLWTESEKQDVRSRLLDSLKKKVGKLKQVAAVEDMSMTEHISMAEKISAVVSTPKSDTAPQSPTSIIAPLYNGLMSTLKFILRYLRQQKPEPSYYQSLESSAIALLLWGNDHAVSNNGLDKALRHSKSIQDTVMLVLVLISELVTKCLGEFLPVDMRKKFIGTFDLFSVTSMAISMMKKPDDVEMYRVKRGQQGEELCDTIQTRINYLQIIDTSLACPAKEEEEHQSPMARDRTMETSS